METERDFSKAKDEYTNANGEVKDLHMAVCMFHMPGNQINRNKQATKRKLPLPATHLQGINTEIKPYSDDDQDERYQKSMDSSSKKIQNQAIRRNKIIQNGMRHTCFLFVTSKKENPSPFRSTTSLTVDRSYC